MLRTRLKQLGISTLFSTILLCGCFTRYSMVRPVSVYGHQDEYVEVYTKPVEYYGIAGLDCAYGPGFHYDPYSEWYGDFGFHFSIGFHVRPFGYYSMLDLHRRPVFYHWGRYWFADSFPFWHYPVCSVVRFPRHFYHHHPAFGFPDWGYRSHHGVTYRQRARWNDYPRYDSYTYNRTSKKKGRTRGDNKPRTFSKRDSRSVRDREVDRGRPTDKRIAVDDRSKNEKRTRRSVTVRKPENRKKDTRTTGRNTQGDRKRTIETSERNKAKRSITSRNRNPAISKNNMRAKRKNREATSNTSVTRSPEPRRNLNIKRKRGISKSTRPSPSVDTKRSRTIRNERRKVNTSAPGREKSNRLGVSPKQKTSPKLSNRSGRSTVRRPKTSVQKSSTRSVKRSAGAEDHRRKSNKPVSRKSSKTRKKRG